MEIRGCGSEFKPKGDMQHIDIELVKKFIQAMLWENLNELFGQPIHKWYALLNIITHTIQFIHLRYSVVFRIFMVVQP